MAKQSQTNEQTKSDGDDVVQLKRTVNGHIYGETFRRRDAEKLFKPDHYEVLRSEDVTTR